MQTLPQQVNQLITDKKGQLSTYPFPPNIAGVIPKGIRQQIIRYMLEKYIWPQYSDRLAFEADWERLLNMAKAIWKISDMQVLPKSRLAGSMREKIQEGLAAADGRSDVADTVVFDAIDRLTNLSQFISYKEQIPVQFELPKYVRRPHENDVYAPSKDLVDAGNALLKTNADSADLYGNDMMLKRHYYTYGMCVVNSEFKFRIDTIPRFIGGVWQDTMELGDIGVSYEGISIRKLWLNRNIPLNKMDLQPCPFFFEQMPRFAIIANVYKPQINPFGYDNLDSLPRAQWLSSATEAQAWLAAMNAASGTGQNISISIADPQFNVEMKWVLYPMLPLAFYPLQGPEGEEYLQSLQSEEERQEAQLAGGFFDFDHDGTKGYPFKRFIMEAFGGSLIAGEVEIIRLQENFYPRGSLPIYGASHMADLDSGAYSSSIGSILENHYVQLCKAFNQFLDNKDLLNDPPNKVQQNSPAMTRDLNKKGAKIPVNSLNDYDPMPITDGTGTTVQFLSHVREQAQTSSKAVDAILGKAMGSRTSATEASNIFQTAMSGVTTDINLYTRDTAGVYAYRVWDYWGIWVDPDIVAAITGQFGFTLKPEHFQIKLGLNWAIGSHFIESITRQGNYRYILETSKGDPTINSAYLWRELLTEWKIGNIDKIVNDSGREAGILEATDQVIRTYLGEDLVVDPDQNHEIAIQVIMSFLKDRNSTWNTNPDYALNSPKILQRLQIHQKFLELQLQQQQLMLQMNGEGEGEGGASRPSAPQIPNGKAGQVAQQHGGILQ